MTQGQAVRQQVQTQPSTSASPSFAKILVATDFSETSLRALEHALSLARHYGSRIFLAHVIPLDLLMSPELSEAPLEGLRRAAHEGMERIQNSGRLVGVRHEEIIEEGYLWPSIESLIQQHGIDLVVVGTHGRAIVPKMLLGSTAEEIFRQSRIPVLTVGPGVWREPFYGVELKNILFATAFGPAAEGQAAYAFSLAQEHHSKLTFLHVLQESEEKPDAVHQLEGLIPPHEEMHCLPLFRVERGDPAAEILRVAEDVQADLIVIGAKARKSLAAHVPHSSAYQVVCGASCPVLTIRS
ncbi:MAG TPA: universal stress protein [Candidatus Acidoferrum sp.]|nr:universal stress protein [Candidatus Acidoferrum sp.]